MAHSSDNLDEEITGINVTPLVDVMLVLLIIFMVTASYIVNQSIAVQLPKAGTGDDVSAKNLTFVIDKESQLYLDGEQVAYEQLAELIASRKATGGALQALIAADRGTPHGMVVKLIDTIRKNGITEFAINVETE